MSVAQEASKNRWKVSVVDRTGKNPDEDQNWVVPEDGKSTVAKLQTSLEGSVNKRRVLAGKAPISLDMQINYGGDLCKVRDDEILLELIPSSDEKSGFVATLKSIPAVDGGSNAHDDEDSDADTQQTEQQQEEQKAEEQQQQDQEDEEDAVISDANNTILSQSATGRTLRACRQIEVVYVDESDDEQPSKRNKVEVQVGAECKGKGRVSGAGGRGDRSSRGGGGGNSGGGGGGSSSSGGVLSTTRQLWLGAQMELKSGPFSRRKWPKKSVTYTVVVGLCEERNFDGVEFRHANLDDCQGWLERPGPTMREKEGPMKGKGHKVRASMRGAFRRQLEMYFMLKKVVVDPQGNIFRATNKEIRDYISKNEEIPQDWNVETYIAAVKHMFWTRRPLQT